MKAHYHDALDLTTQGPPFLDMGTRCTGTPPRHVQTCSLWSMYSWQADGCHPTEILSCSNIFCPQITLDTRNQLLEKVAQPLENLQVRLMNDETFVIKYPNVTFLSIDQGLHLDSLGETSCLYYMWTSEHIAIFEVNVSDICQFIVTEIQCPRLKVLRVKGCPNLTKLLLEVDSVSDLDISQSMPLNSLRHLHVITSSSKLLAKILSQVIIFAG